MKQSHLSQHIRLFANIPLLLFLVSILFGLSMIPAKALATEQISTLPKGPTGEMVICMAQPSSEHCTGFDPASSGCTQQSQIVKRINVLHSGREVGQAQLHYSPICESYWLRGVAAANSPISTMRIVLITRKDGAGLVATASLLLSGEQEVYGPMFHQKPPSGTDARITFEFNDHSPSQEIQVV